MAHASQKLKLKSTHSPSVKFEPSSKEKYPITNGFYLNRGFAEHTALKCDDLDDVLEIEITVRITKRK
jgi:hypothetical protein